MLGLIRLSRIPIRLYCSVNNDCDQFGGFKEPSRIVYKQNKPPSAKTLRTVAPRLNTVRKRRNKLADSFGLLTKQPSVEQAFDKEVSIPRGKSRKESEIDSDEEDLIQIKHFHVKKTQLSMVC